jgi:hypothetical protein
MDEKMFTSRISGEVRYSVNGNCSYFQPHDLPFDLDIPRSIYRRSLDAVISLSNLNGRVSATTAAKLLSDLEGDGVVREVSGRKRRKLYLADGVIEILGNR